MSERPTHYLRENTRRRPLSLSLTILLSYIRTVSSSTQLHLSPLDSTSLESCAVFNVDLYEYCLINDLPDPSDEALAFINTISNNPN